MSLLPGGGQFYNGQIGLGILNLIFWPLSYFWSIPSAILDAKSIRIYRNAERWRRKKEKKMLDDAGRG
jgi:TM2 domain-containing membrane protein YozV